MASRTMVRSQVRGFAVVWTSITIIIGIATFFAIYVAYDAEADDTTAESPITQEPAAAAVVPTIDATPVPTGEILPTNTPIPPSETPVEVAQAVEEESVEAEEEAPAEEDIGSAAALEQEDPPEPEPEPTPEPTLPPMARDDFQLSIQVQRSIDGNPEIQQMWMDDVRGLNIDMFKQQIRWEEIEPEPGVYDWSSLDLTIPPAQEYGFNIVGSVVAAPDWAREAGADLSQDGPPADMAAFGDFLGAMIERYPDTFFAMEIWNEPNLEREWASPNGLSARGVVEMQQIAYEVLKEAEPGLIVISAALSPTGGFVDGQGITRAIDDFDFMEQMIEAGLLNYTDCIGAHHNGYNLRPIYYWDEVPNDPTAGFRGPFNNPHHSWSFRSTLETYVTMIRVAGGEQKLCVTEFGWPSVEDLDGSPEGFGFALDNTLEEQAEWTIEAIELMEDSGDVWIANLWNLNYGPQAGWDTNSDNTPYSFIGPEFAKRPVYSAVASWAAENQ